MIVRAKAFWLVLSVFIAMSILGSLLWSLGRNGAGSVCDILNETTPRSIVAEGAFHTRDDSLMYIGDKAGFNLTVVYDQEHVELKERSLLNFNPSPYELIYHSEINTTTNSECAKKSIFFLLQGLSLDAGKMNKFQYVDGDGFPREPKIEYVQDGRLKLALVGYSPPYVVSLTNGRAQVLGGVPKELLPHEKRTGQVLGWAMLVGGLSLIVIAAVLFLVLHLRRFKAQSAEKRNETGDLSDLFPELYQENIPHIKRLSRLYFRVEEIIPYVYDGLLVEILRNILDDKIINVFSGKLSSDGGQRIIYDLRMILEQYSKEVREACSLRYSENGGARP